MDIDEIALLMAEVDDDKEEECWLEETALLAILCGRLPSSCITAMFETLSPHWHCILYLYKHTSMGIRWDISLGQEVKEDRGMGARGGKRVGRRREAGIVKNIDMSPCVLAIFGNSH